MKYCPDPSIHNIKYDGQKWPSNYGEFGNQWAIDIKKAKESWNVEPTIEEVIQGVYLHHSEILETKMEGVDKTK